MNKSRLLLMEIMISIAFFAIGLSVCVSLFADAHIQNRNSRERMRAIALTETVQGIISKKNLEDISEYFGVVKDKETITIYFDESLNQTIDKYIYIVTVTEQSDKYMVKVSTEKDNILVTTFTLHHPYLRGEA